MYEAEVLVQQILFWNELDGDVLRVYLHINCCLWDALSIASSISSIIPSWKSQKPPVMSDESREKKFLARKEKITNLLNATLLLLAFDSHRSKQYLFGGGSCIPTYTAIGFLQFLPFLENENRRRSDFGSIRRPRGRIDTVSVANRNLVGRNGVHRSVPMRNEKF